MNHLAPVRILGALFAAALTLMLSAASPMAASAAGTGKPSTPAAAKGSPATPSLPSGATACASSRAKPSSSVAACGTRAATAASSTATVHLPGGAVACPSTADKPSSGTAACAATAPRAAAAAAATFTVSLVAGSPNLAPGGTSLLTATANQDVGPTPYFIEIFDLTTGALVVECGFGTSCATTVTQSGSTFQDYFAYVSSFGTTVPPPNIQATSGIVVVTWMTITLDASPTVLLPGRTTLLTATASLDVGPTPYFIEIFDILAGTFVVECGSGSTCSSFVTRQSGISEYIAYISGFSTTFPPANIRSESGGVNVTWISLGLGAAPASLPAGGTASVTAASSVDVGPSPYWIVIVDTTSNTAVAICGFGTFCTASVSQPGATTHGYVAYVSAFPGSLPPADIRATSNTVSVQWTPVQTVTVPNLFDLLDSDARSAVQTAGLVLGGDNAVVDCNELGRVDDQSPAAGTQVAAGSAVTISHGVRPASPAVCP
jgi:PASTA domain